MTESCERMCAQPSREYTSEKLNIYFSFNYNENFIINITMAIILAA